MILHNHITLSNAHIEFWLCTLMSWIRNRLKIVVQTLSFGVNKHWWLLNAKCYHVFLWHHVQNMGYLVVLDNNLMLCTNGHDKKPIGIGVWVFKFLVNVLIDCKCD
jgi:hypothetical protein